MATQTMTPPSTSIPPSSMSTSGWLTIRTAAVFTLVALFSVVTSVIGIAAATAQTGSAGCGTGLLEVSENVGNVPLVGNEGPQAATSTIQLSQSLSAGTYAVRTVSMDRHWSERRDQPREQYTVTVGSETVGPTTDLPMDADFLGAMTATSSDENLGNVPVDVFPGELLGTITLAGGEDRFTLTHVDGGAGNGSNSISAHRVTFTCVATDLDISFSESSVRFASDGTATAALAISNTGTLDQSGIRVRSVLPAGLDRNGIVDASSGTSTSIGATTRWEGDLAAGENVVVTIPVITTASGYSECVGTSAGCTLTAEIVGADEGTPTTDPASIDFTATADLELTTSYVSANDDSSQFAGTITVAISNSPDDFMNVTANDVVITSDLGGSLSIDATSIGVVAGSVSSDDGTLRWDLGSIAPGDSAAYSVDVILPGVGSFSVRSQIVSSSVTDPDSTPNSLAARAGDDDVSVAEDDEAAVLATAVTSTTTTSTTTTTFTTTSLPTTTTRAPLVVELEATSNVEPEFQLDLTEQEVIDLTALDEPGEEESSEPEDDRTEVAGAVELPESPIPTLDVDQNTRAPLAAFIAGLLVLLSAGIVMADRYNSSKLESASVLQELSDKRQ